MKLEGKSNMITSCKYLEEKLWECSQTEGVEMANSVETLGFDLRTQTEQLGANEKTRRKKCKVLTNQKEAGLPEKLHEDRSEKSC